MYKDVLGYEIDSIAHEYYADKENAYDMKLFFDKSIRDKVSKEAKKNAGNDAAD